MCIHTLFHILESFLKKDIYCKWVWNGICYVCCMYVYFIVYMCTGKIFIIIAMLQKNNPHFSKNDCIWIGNYLTKGKLDSRVASQKTVNVYIIFIYIVKHNNDNKIKYRIGLYVGRYIYFYLIISPLLSIKNLYT